MVDRFLSFIKKNLHFRPFLKRWFLFQGKHLHTNIQAAFLRLKLLVTEARRKISLFWKRAAGRKPILPWRTIFNTVAQLAIALQSIKPIGNRLRQKRGYLFFFITFTLHILLSLVFLSALSSIVIKPEPKKPQTLQVVDVSFQEKTLCTLPSQEVFHLLIDELDKDIPWLQNTGTLQSAVTLYEREIISERFPFNLEAAKEALRIHLGGYGWGFQICNEVRPLISLSSLEEAEKVIDAIAETYLPEEKEGTIILSVSHSFKEEPKIVPGLTAADNILSVEEALFYLLKGTREEKTYTVQTGETIWGISRKYEMSMAEMIKANPDIDPDYIYPGDVLNLIVPKPFFTLQATYNREYKRYIPFKTIIQFDEDLYRTEYIVETSGKHGSEKVVERVRTENGRILDEEILETSLLETPRTAVVTRGTHRTPDDILISSQILPPDIGIITSLFGPRWGRFHNGIDIGIPIGTPVHAYEAGTVIFSGYSNRLGKMVIIEHENNLLTRYGHFSKHLVSLGDWVEKGEPIGLSGNTGYSTGPHVHFEIHEDSMLRDPLVFIKSRTQPGGPVLASEEADKLERDMATGGSR
jgi:murein DD-endopeptidase MepM/ murein hydrolase activator NlpD